MHSILQSGGREGRQTVFFTALDPMNEEPGEEYKELSRTTKGTLQEQVENYPRCDPMDEFEKSSGQRIKILANPI